MKRIVDYSANGRDGWLYGRETLWLRLEEGQGTAVYDGSYSQIHGGIVGADWDTGKVGSYCLNFAGTAASDGKGNTVHFSSIGAIVNDWTIAFWFNASNVSGTQYLFDTTVGGNRIYITFSSLHIRVVIFDNGGANYKDYKTATVLKNDVWFHCAVTWDGTDLKIWLNGAEDMPYVKTNDDAVTMTNTARLVHIGSRGNLNYGFRGKLDDIRVIAESLTQPEILELYNNGSGSSTPIGIIGAGKDAEQAHYKMEDTNGFVTDSSANKQHSIYSGVNAEIMWFPFDDDNDTEQKIDVSGNANFGWATGTATGTAKVGDYALTFDGSTSYVQCKTDTYVTDSWSISMWVKWSSMAGQQNLFSLGPTSGNANRIYLGKHSASHGSYPNQLYFYKYGSGSTLHTITGDTTLAVDTWYHILAWYNGTDLRLYLNGSQDTPYVETGAAEAMTSTSRACYIGAYHTTHLYKFAGVMDDFRFFDDNVIQADIDSIYNSGSGSLYPARSETGKVGQAIRFDASSSKIDMGSGGGLGDHWSFACWFKKDVAAAGVFLLHWEEAVGNENEIQLIISSSKVRAKFYDSGGTVIKDWSGDTTIVADTWYYVVYTWSGSDDTFKIYLGTGASISEDTPYSKTTDNTANMIDTTRNRYVGSELDSTSEFDGELDDVRIFSKALTSAEVTTLFNGGDGTADTLSATFNNCFKMGSNAFEHVNFDFNAINSLDDFSVCFWVKLDSLNASINTVLNCYDAANPFNIGYNAGTNNWVLNIGGATDSFSDSTVEDLDWHWICVTRKSSNTLFDGTAQGEVYVDNSRVGTGQSIKNNKLVFIATSTLLGQEQDSLWGGFAANQSLAGRLCDFRVYPFELTSTQRGTIYNSGDGINTSLRGWTKSFRDDYLGW